VINRRGKGGTPPHDRQLALLLLLLRLSLTSQLALLLLRLSLISNGQQPATISGGRPPLGCARISRVTGEPAKYREAFR